MENEENKTGLLLNQHDIKLNRVWFREAVKLLGIYVLYRAPKPNKRWTTYTEIDSNYEEPLLVGCLFHDHPDLKTMKKIGWNAELLPNASVIEVDYDLPNLLVGALFIVPSGLDDGKGRLFRVSSMLTSMVYPSSITCEIVPEYYDTFNKSKDLDYSHTSINHLNREDTFRFST